MARRTTPQSPQPAVLTSDQLKQGIQLLTKRLDAVKKFDPTSVPDRFKSPELTALRASVAEALARTFGPDTLDYQRYSPAAEFYDGPIFLGGGGMPAAEVHEHLATSKAESIALLQQAIDVMK